MATSHSFTEMRRRNCDDIVSLVRKNQALSRADLAKESGLAKATVSAIVDELIQKEVFREVGVKVSSGGRPAVGLAFDPEFACVVGISLDESEIAFCLLDLDGKLKSQSSHKLPEGWNSSDAGKYLFPALDKALAKIRCSRKKIFAVGTAIPGPVGVELVSGEKEGRYASFLSLVKTTLKCSLLVDSNTNMAAVAEISQNQIPDSDVVFVLRCGHKIRCALVCDGKILQGIDSLAGEFGHLKMPDNTFICECGMSGCINTAASIDAMLERCREGGRSTSDLVDFNALCQAGETDVLAIVRQAGLALAWGLSSAINLLAPHVVIISVPSSLEKQLLIDSIKESLSQLALGSTLDKCTIIAASSDGTAECYGAGLFALKHLDFLELI